MKSARFASAGFIDPFSKTIMTLLMASCLCATALAAGVQPTVPTIVLQQFVTGLSSPVELQAPKDGSGRLFVVEQGGTIRIIQGGALLPDPFLDITSIIESGDEKGLLTMAFHPQYAQNGRFFVDYTRRVSGQLQSVIAEYHVSSTDPNKADPASGKEILVVDQPFDNHNGGRLAFGPDTYLYISFGDGGSGGDPFGNGQNLGVLLGKILRIDIDSASPYAIPPDNPFVGNPDDRGEIWAYGLRYTWRYSFDRVSKQLFAADVGQDDWEEVDIITKGGNYGWNVMEGRHCYPSNIHNCDRTGLALPIAEYPHSVGYAVIGGFVYRGAAMPALRGIYIFGDLNGKIWGLRQVSGSWKMSLLLSTGKSLSSFGQDVAGELYLLDLGNGIVYRIRAGQ